MPETQEVARTSGILSYLLGAPKGALLMIILLTGSVLGNYAYTKKQVDDTITNQQALAQALKDADKKYATLQMVIDSRDEELRELQQIQAGVDHANQRIDDLYRRGK